MLFCYEWTQINTKKSQQVTSPDYPSIAASIKNKIVPTFTAGTMNNLIHSFKKGMELF